MTAEPACCCRSCRPVAALLVAGCFVLHVLLPAHSLSAPSLSPVPGVGARLGEGWPQGATRVQCLPDCALLSASLSGIRSAWTRHGTSSVANTRLRAGRGGGCRCGAGVRKPLCGCNIPAGAWTGTSGDDSGCVSREAVADPLGKHCGRSGTDAVRPTHDMCLLQCGNDTSARPPSSV